MGCRGLLAWAMLVLLLLGQGDLSAAAEVEGLYQAQVPVAGQGQSERARAMTEALRLVVLKVTGRRDAQAAVRRADASGFVRQFRYIVDQASQGQSAQPGLVLWAQFDEAAVDGWLRDKGLVVRGTSRPGTLLWLGIERNGERELFVPDLDPATTRLIRDAAAAHGIGIVFPLVDLEDRGRLSATALWEDSPEKLRAASQRYRPDAVLSGRLSRLAAGGWSAQWTLVQGDRVRRWHDEQADLAAALSGGLGKTADVPATRLVPVSASGAADLLDVRVSNVLSLADYERVRRHLASLESVRAVDLLGVEPDAVRLRLSAGSAEGLLAQSLELGGMLVPTSGSGTAVSPSGAAAPGAAPVLEYRLSP